MGHDYGKNSAHHTAFSLSSSNPFGCCHNGRIRRVTPYQLLTLYFRNILRRSTVDTLYIGLVGIYNLSLDK
ncbi:hypothetical protein ANCDUO_08020 [Ancylostoma duodenale]|uniref:Uncharacterized protein n=1 Tax=Ancylostoma duodenale TaxID=51022 RepID=A0A0C2CXF6_9BILA|nr:hypothetical protein ANCDUO_08020 [Ancylostoma duodenale]